MVRNTLFMLLALAALVASADAVSELRRYSTSKRYVAARDFTTIPGSVITYWYRDGQPDWKMPAVETNVLTIITGRKIDNAIEVARDNAIKDLEKANADLMRITAELNAEIQKYVNASNAVVALAQWKADRETRAEAVKEEINNSKLLTTTLKKWLTDLVDKIFSLEASK